MKEVSIALFILVALVLAVGSTVLGLVWLVQGFQSGVVWKIVIGGFLVASTLVSGARRR